MNIGKKIIAVGKNYHAHAVEMGAKKAPKDPVLFLKPTSSYIKNGQAIEIPRDIGAVHHELELGVLIGKPGKRILESNWESHVQGYVLALDITARDLQQKAKNEGLPWTISKGFDTFTPISDLIHKTDVPRWNNLELWLKVDDELKQKCITGEMVHSIPFLISYISNFMTLNEGDLILTGTPEGVGPILPNQVISAGIKNLVDVSFPVVDRGY